MKIACLGLLASVTAFAGERSVFPVRPGANRLDVDVALLAGAAPDLRDVRLFDAKGREVAYLLIAPRGEERRWIGGRAIAIPATKKSSGFELDLGVPLEIDRVALHGIAAPFLKRVRLEGSGDRVRWTLLSDATVFDLPEEKLRHTEIDFAPGSYRYVRFVWDDRASVPVSTIPAVSARLHASDAAPESLRVSIPFRRRASEPGTSRYRLDLPTARLPVDAIELVVSQDNVHRTASVSEARLAGSEVVPFSLGRAVLRRAERPASVASEMSIPISRPRERRLDLLIQDDDNPPLAIESIRARLAPQPWIYFESPDGAPLIARFGEENLVAPRYDLEASRKFAEHRSFPAARWGTPRANIEETGVDVIETPRGGVVERSAFAIRRSLPATRKGLAVLVLDLDVLARSRDLADVRLIDAAGRQVPYLEEQRAEPLVIRLAGPRRQEKKSASIWSVALPYASLPPGTRLLLKTKARVFTRDVTLRVRREDDREHHPRVLQHTHWHNADPEHDAPPLSFDVARLHSRRVELHVDEGDNTPLEIGSAELLVPSKALRFHHTGEPLTLAYGNANADLPRYDLALIAPRLFGQQAIELVLEPIPAQPEEERTDSRLFWIGVAVAAAVLIVMLARMLRS